MNIPTRVILATMAAMTAGSSTFLLVILVFVSFVVIAIDTDFNFRYNHCLPMRRNFVT
jgi:hypothetical protein